MLNEEKPAEIVLIAAVAHDRVIGNQGKIPWWNDEELRKVDMRRFRSMTWDKPVIMGYTTFLSLGKPLPRRTNIVLSRKEGLYIPGAHVCKNLEEAFSVGKGFHSEVYVIGGGQVYAEAIKQATRLEMTEIDAIYTGDAFFPEYKNTGKWEEVARDPREGFAFVTYKRRNL